MENNQNGTGISLEKFTWAIDNFSKKNIKKLRSNAFEIGGVRWRILVGKDRDHLSLYLKVAEALPAFGWTRFAYFMLVLVNRLDNYKSVARETEQKFNAGYRIWGSLFVPLNDFNNPEHGYLVNNTCIIEAHISVSNVAFNNPPRNLPRSRSCALTVESISSDQTEQSEMMEALQLQDQEIEFSPESKNDQTGQIKAELHCQEDQGIISTSKIETPSPKQWHIAPTAPPLSTYPYVVIHEPVEVPLMILSDLVDFKSLGPEEAAFVPLLEEVCSWHPSLLKIQKKRSLQFIRWAFIALGQVLYFLKTMKIKDMDELACKHLQSLWEELQLFGFALTWLEPYVQSALGMKAYVERAEKVKNLKDKVLGLKFEMRQLRTKLTAVEINLEGARKDLAEVENGFEERNVDAELGYGIF